MSSIAWSRIRQYAAVGLMVFWGSLGFAQFSSNVQGLVEDPSGAVVPKANVTLVNTATQVTRTTTSDENGSYHFLSLAPGAYKITVEASGYAKSESDITLLTEQTLNVPITLKVGAVTEAVTVVSNSAVVDTADSRNQLTLENSGVAELPVAGRNLVTLTTLAPGVSGLGTTGGGQPGRAGTPGSGVDNYSTETQVDASANGQGQMSNMYVIDGLDVTSGIRQGVLNLTPNPESIQETSIQVNTYSPEYSRATGVQEVLTTKSGSEQFHGSAADWFYTQQWFARTHFTDPNGYLPFHGNNMSFSIGGPIIPHKQFFFYFAVEPLRSSLATNGTIQFANPAFVTWAQQNYPGVSSGGASVGTDILSKYVPTGVSGATPDPNSANAPGCGTSSSNFLPCSLPLVSQGVFSAPQIRNGTQYFVRVDKNFKNDRIYGSFYRTLLNYGAASAIPDFSALNNNWQRAFQVNWNHSFSPTLMNETIFAANRVEGVLGSGAKDYTVPSITVRGINTEGGQAFGVGFAQGDFIQHNYHWRDVLTHVRGAHALKIGYEGWFGDDVEPFQGPWSQPTFHFDNFLQLAQDDPTGGMDHVMYDPITGQQVLWSWNAASKTWGLFAEDTWKARRNLTLTLGFRWDDEGNPYSRSATTVFGNFYLGPGQSINEQVANGFARATKYALNHTLNNLWSPRVGFAWDVTGSGNTVLRGGWGLFNNWLTQANVQEEFRGSPPGPILPGFPEAVAMQHFHLGTSDKPPFGFDFPPLVGSSICPTLGPSGCLNSQGGIVGGNFGIGGINPNLESPRAHIWSLTLERKLGNNYSAAVGYSGSHGYNLVGGGDQAGIVSYGQDINAFAGDLIVNNISNNVATRLNPSFGAINYTDNTRRSNYESVYFQFKGRFARRGFLDASYTRSASKDNASAYPAEADPNQYYGPSPWDVPNRFSLTLNYELPGLNNGQGLAGRLTGGWGISGTSIYQSGYPAMVWTTGRFIGVCASATNCPSSGNPYIGYATGSGDFNADGDTGGAGGVGLDYPDVSSYSQGTSRNAFLTGSLLASNFPNPAFGGQGNERPNAFRSPNFVGTDVNFYKNTHVSERVNFQLRFEFFNIFNRPNLTNFDTNLVDGGFGKANAQQLPRNWQLGARLSF
jgi:hypothetical protein